MKKLIAVAALGAILFSVSPAVFAGEQEGPVFEPQPVPPSVQPLQGTQNYSSGEDTWQPLNPDIRG
ncbi:MAG TPA: hypothetical protein VFM39_08325 [bacterium]|nr:hypothetical protein [bacterium]